MEMIVNCDAVASNDVISRCFMTSSSFLSTVWAVGSSASVCLLPTCNISTAASSSAAAEEAEFHVHGRIKQRWYIQTFCACAHALCDAERSPASHVTGFSCCCWIYLLAYSSLTHLKCVFSFFETKCALHSVWAWLDCFELYSRRAVHTVWMKSRSKRVKR